MPGEQAERFSPAVVRRRKGVWLDETKEGKRQDPGDCSMVHVWADGAYCGLRSEDAKPCCPAITGADDRGRKTILAMGTGCVSPRRAGRKYCRPSRAKA